MFEYDPGKSDTNRAKHGIDFEAAQLLWLDERLLVIPARTGEPPELRWLAVGRIGERHWSAIFTNREGRIRLISVRRAREEEEEIYDRQIP